MQYFGANVSVLTKLKKKKKQIPKQTKMVYINKCQCLTVKVRPHLSLFSEFLIAKFSQLNRNPHDCENYSQISQQVQVGHVNSLC